MLSYTEFEDNMIGMSRYPDKFFELAVVDPQYGINAPNLPMGSAPNRKDMKGNISVAKRLKGRLNSGGGKLKNRILNQSDIDWDDAPPPKEYFDELFRVSENQIIWGGNYFDLPPTRGIICWDKQQPWENFSQWEMAWTSFDKPAAMFRFSNTGGANKEAKIHPTQKPVELYRWVYNKYAKPGDKILDTHAGSMSSVIAAVETGFEITAFEITAFENNKKYYMSAIERIEKRFSQKSMFNDAVKIIRHTNRVEIYTQDEYHTNKNGIHDNPDTPLF